MADPAPSSDIGWPQITHQNKPWVRWWWLGSAVDKPNLTRELEQIAGHGFGGVEITPLYGAVGYESKYIDFLSPQYMAMLEFTGNEAKRLDLGVDMATGTGWPFGGPWITPENADAMLARDPSKLVERPTRMKVKRAAPGDEGWVVNPFSVDAINAYLKPFDNAFGNAKFPRGLIRSQFHDSFEYSGNWTHELPEQFKQMHGYDLPEHIKELWGDGDADTTDTVVRVRSDYRETLGQMHLDYLKVWVKWSHDHGMLARNQAHGSPGNLLDLYAVADICETETFGSTPFEIPGFRRETDDIGRSEQQPNPLIARFASSAAHVAGHDLASCETFTWLREHFKAPMSAMKPEADQMFLAGINHLIYHGCCYSPEDAQWPGWNFYASVEFNPRNTIWRDLPAMNAYYARVQAILQSGKPDNDVLVYWPFFDAIAQPAQGGKPQINFTVHNAFTDDSSLGKVGKWLTDHGYSFDYISDAQLQAREKLEPYRAIVVPACKRMPVETMSALLKFAENGTTVIFEDALPSDVPGMGDLSNRLAAMKALLAKAQPKVRVGKLADLIGDAKVSREFLCESGLRFIRRTFDGGHHYFIANLTGKTLKGWFPLSVDYTSAAILNPLSGKGGVSLMNKKEIYLDLAPDESIILRTFASKKIEGEPYSWFDEGKDEVAIAGKWQCEYVEGEPKVGPFSMDKLASWTTLNNDDLNKFGGTIAYRIEFDAPTTPADDWMLDLGDVRDSARLLVNGKEVATLWSLPFQTPIGSFVKPGKNTLEIQVTNVAANRIRDLDARKVEWKKFHEINFVNIHYRPFDASTWPLTDSGLLGPVKLVAMKKVN